MRLDAEHYRKGGEGAWGKVGEELAGRSPLLPREHDESRADATFSQVDSARERHDCRAFGALPSR